MIVFEDLHWADDALLELIDYLVAHVHDASVVFLALARPEFVERRPGWGAGLIGQTTLPLEPLTTDEAGRVAASLLGGARPEVIERVVAAAGGNPLFLEELVASIGEAAPGELPSTIRAAVGARIDALPPDVRTLLLYASVIGRSFWQGVLERVTEAADVGSALEELEARGLVLRRPRSQVEGDAEFSIKHDLIRDVAYETLPRATRRRLHAATAEAIETSVQEPRELAWILAHHWREAGEPERAIAYFLDAADRARGALAVEETYDYYARALELAGDDDHRRQIRLRRGLALVELEDYARAERELGELLGELEGQDQLEALLARSHATLWTERTDETLDQARRLVGLVGNRGVVELQGPALAILAAAYAMRGEDGDLEEAISSGDRALEVWVPGTRRRELAEHYHLHADHAYWTGDYGRALELTRLAAETGGGEPHSIEFVLRGAGMEGLVLAGLGRYEEALQTNEAAIGIAREMGRSTNVVVNYSTSVLRDIFDLEEARRRSEEVADRLGPSEFNMPWMNARADVIAAAILQGDLGTAERLWPSAWEDALGSVAWEHWLVSGRLAAARAELELEMGRPDEAVAWARRALTLARRTRRRKYEAVTLETLGRALTAQGLADRAVSELRRAVSAADAVGSPLARWRARAALAGALARSSERDGESEVVWGEAAGIVRRVLGDLAPKRAARYRSDRRVAEVLAAAPS
jgi:tetratricopeptide (TPR) repeat protein